MIWPKRVFIVILILLIFIIVTVANIGKMQLLFSRAAEPRIINDTPVTKSVFLLILNPVIENQGGKTLIQVMNWNDPDRLSADIISAVHDVSHGYVTYTITQRQEVDSYLSKPSGFQFTDDTYLACVYGTGPCNSEIIDYQKLFSDFNLCSKNVDEVWVWGGPWLGFWEYNPVFYCGKLQFVMGFNPERFLAEAMEDFGHRMEYVGNTRLGNGAWGYNTASQNENNDWNKFTLISTHCGNIHYPPGNPIGGKEYYSNNPATVTTDCDGYLNYPAGPFIPRSITCAAWGCSQEGFVRWWLTRIPSTPGTTTTIDGKTVYNNWWKYYAYYQETQIPLPTPPPIIPPTVSPTSTPFPGSLTVTSPNGGESFVADSGDPINIQWNSNRNFDHISIYYVTNNGITRAINYSVPDNGSYLWIPHTDSPTLTQYKIKIEGYTSGILLAGDQSDNYFTVTQPTPTATVTPVPGDLNGDLHVDIFDYNILVTNFGHPYTIYDYNALVANFGV